MTKPSARQPPWDKSEAGSSGSFGEWLRRQREMREISLRDIADRTKISLRYLEAMEEDRFDLLPAPIFAKGFLREYARYVGLSPDEVVNHWLSVQEPEETEESAQELRRRDRRPSWTWGVFLLLLGALLLALVAGFSYLNEKRRNSPRQEESPPPMAAPPLAATPSSAPPPPEAPKAPLEVTLDFSGDCWVNVITDGKNRLSELHAQGESLPLEARESILFLKLGNAGAVHIQVNGYPLELSQGDGRVVSDLRIDLDTVRALREKERRADVADSQASLLEQVRSGANRQLQMLAAGGLLPLSLEDLIPLQVGFVVGGDHELAVRAVEALRAVDVRFAVPFLEQRAGHEVLAFFAAEASDPRLIECIVRRRDVPRRLLVELARRVPPELQEIIILRQDAIVEEPAILDALESNPQRSNYIQRRIAEYREHLLPRDRRPAYAQVIEEISEEELAEAIAKVRTLPGEGEVETQTGLSEGQIRMLPVPARLKLSRGASRLLRSILLRDSNVQVALSALLHNSLAEQELEQIAASRAVAEEVLEAITKKREWISRYNLARTLVFNPRTPLPAALRLVNRLSVRDLRDLGRDRNVPDAVRSTALRLYRIKQQ